MKHFDRQEWLTFHQDETSAEQQRNMEDHLLECEDCLQVFLDSIDVIQIDQAKLVIASDFTAQTLSLVQAQEASTEPSPTSISSSESLEYGLKPKNLDYKQKARLRRRLLSYYVAAASVTLMLMSTGVFQSAINQAANMPVAFSLQAPEKQPNLLFNWPTQLREKTSSWLGNLEWNNLKEVK